MSSSARGNTFVEVMVSVLLFAIIVGTVFSVPLAAKRAKLKTDQKVAAALAGKQVLETLKAYVTADPAAGRGPGEGTNGWSLPGDACRCYALSPGVHVLDAATWFAPYAGPPYNAALSYTVAAAGAQPDVTLKIDWNNP